MTNSRFIDLNSGTIQTHTSTPLFMDFVPSAYDFRRCVERYHGNFKVKSFSCWDQFLTLAFA